MGGDYALTEVIQSHFIVYGMSSVADMFIAVGCLLKKFQFYFDVYSN